MARNIILITDGVRLKIKNVPRKKYDNYRILRFQKQDLKTFKAHAYPYRIQLEPTNICNLKCAACPVANKKLNRPPKHMTLEEFKGIMDDISDYLLNITFWDWGEPFMNPQLPNMIKHATDHGITSTTSTNAHFLKDEKYLERILTSGLTILFVAIDATSKQAYQKFRGAGDPSELIKDFKNLVRLKKKLKSKTLIAIRLVLTKDNEKERDKMRRLAKKLGADIFAVKAITFFHGMKHDNKILPKDQRNRRLHYKDGKRVKVKNVCNRHWLIPNIHSNGMVVPCWHDYAEDVQLGNVYEKPLTEIWNSAKYRQYRKDKHDQVSNPFCDACAYNYKFSKDAEFNEITYLKHNLIQNIYNYLFEVIRKKRETSTVFKKFSNRIHSIFLR
ncbi:SPASM domain-containing protein [Thermoproteota archaeon]